MDRQVNRSPRFVLVGFLLLLFSGSALQGAVQIDVVWKRPLGSGYSGIAVAEDRVVTMFSDGSFDYAAAFDAGTGAEIWRFRLGETYRGHGGSENGPSSTPILDGAMVYGLGPLGLLFAVGLSDGQPFWTREINKEFGAKPALYGFVTTPVVEGNVLVVQTGGPEKGAISGFDKRTGELLWSAVDDTVGYQSPAIMTLAGRRQLVAVTDTRLSGLDPETGEILWTYSYSEEGGSGCARAVQVDSHRFLVSASSSGFGWPVKGALYELGLDGDGIELRQIWQSNAIKNSYALPAHQGGHLYAFNGRFLTCVDARTGEEIWKSRAPGGQALALGESALAILASRGDLVLVDPSPDGYRELARAPIMETGSYTAPAVAPGRVYLRNHVEIAAVALNGRGPGPTPIAEEHEALGNGAFARFIHLVRAAADKTTLVDAFMGSGRTFPVVEEGGRVHFVYRGEAEDVAILGSMTDLSGPEPLTRLEGTDLFFRSYSFETGTRWEYLFDVDFGQITRDPLNPRHYVTDFGEMSEVALPGWEEPAHLAEPTGERGRIQTFTLKSTILGQEREVNAYLPPGWREDRDYPLLIVTSGPAALQFGKLDRSLDNLIGEQVAPVVVAFVSPLPYPARYSEFLGDGARDFARMLAEELVPHVQREFRTRSRPDARALLGTFESAQATLYAAVLHPDVFGKVAVRGVRLQPPIRDSLVDILSGEQRLPVQFYVDWNRDDWRNPDFDVDLRRDSRRITDLLKRQGYAVAGGEFPGGGGWGSWRTRNDVILQELFPAGPPEGEE